MSTDDLRALGFREMAIPPFYGHCAACGRSRWFDWFIGGSRYRLDVSACRECRTVPARLVAQVEAAVVARRHVAEMVSQLDDETREELELKGTL